MRVELDKSARFQPIRAAAKMMGFDWQLVYALCKSGDIPCIRMGRDYRVDMEAWGKKLTEQSAVQAQLKPKQNGAE